MWYFLEKGERVRKNNNLYPHHHHTQQQTIPITIFFEVNREMGIIWLINFTFLYEMNDRINGRALYLTNDNGAQWDGKVQCNLMRNDSRMNGTVFFLQTKCLLIKWKLCFRLFFDLSDSHFNNNLLVWVLMGLAFFNWVNRLLANKPAVIFFFRLLHEVRRRKKNKLPNWIYILFYDSRFNIRIGQAWKIVVFMGFMCMWIRVI